MAAVNGPARCADCGSRPPPRATDGGPPFAWCTSCTSLRLRQHAEALAQRLLPGGHWEGHLWRAGASDGSAGASLAFYLAGRKRGHWRDFAGSEAGDLLDLIAVSPHTGCGGDKRRALRWAHEFLRAPTPAPLAGPAMRPVRQPTPEQTHKYIRGIWHEAQPLAPDDLGWRYFLARGIDLARLPPIPTLRIHPGLRHQEAKRTFPAMLAVIVGPDGAPFAGILRTFLTVSNDGGVVKAPVEKPKMCLGSCAGGCIPLTRGASGRSWRDPEPGGLVAIGEGLEDSLSIAAALPALRVVCAVSLSNMRWMRLPAAIGEVALIGQNDPANSKATKLFKRVRGRFEQLGKRVQVLRPGNPEVKDVNDLARRLYSRSSAAADGADRDHVGPDA
jgi:hypothetical protein